MAERYAGPDRREGAAAAAYTPMLDSCTIACAEKSSAFCSRARPACAEALPVRLQMAMRAAKKRRPGGGDCLRIAHDFGQTSGGGAAMPITNSGISASRTRFGLLRDWNVRACVRAYHSGWTLKDPSKLCRATMRFMCRTCPCSLTLSAAAAPACTDASLQAVARARSR